MYLMGIDLGTSNCKVVVYDMQGEIISSESFKTPIESYIDGFAEYNPEKLWESLTNTVKSITSKASIGENVISIGISSQAESGLFVDQDNKPLTNIIAWYDQRTKSLLNYWKEQITDTELFSITGLDLNYIHSILKIQWHKINMPEIFDKADRWQCMPDYYSRKICGCGAMEYSIASRTMAFDIKKREWSKKILSIADISNDLFPEVVSAGTVLGVILPEIAQEWGLNKELVVGAGGFDHMCGCMGVGASSENSVIASIGSTESVCLTRTNIENIPSSSGYSYGCHVFPNKYYMLGGMPSGGDTIEWAIKSLLGENPNNESYQRFDEFSRLSCPGSNGLVFIPQLKGSVTPEVDPYARGVFAGIGINTSQSDFCRSVLEGLAFEFKLVLESSGISNIKSIVAIGGGTKNTHWMQIKADVLQIPVQIADVEDSVTLGAAYLGGFAAGILSELPPKNISNSINKIYQPNKSKAGFYTNIFNKVYLPLASSKFRDVVKNQGGTI